MLTGEWVRRAWHEVSEEVTASRGFYGEGRNYMKFLAVFILKRFRQKELDDKALYLLRTIPLNDAQFVRNRLNQLCSMLKEWRLTLRCWK